MNRTILALAFAALLPLASSYADEPVLVSAASDHFEIYTTGTAAAGKAALKHFETVRGYLLQATKSTDPFEKPVRIVAFKSSAEFRKYLMGRPEDAKAFRTVSDGRILIASSTLKPADYEYATREYVLAFLEKNGGNLPYWIRFAWGELYSTLRVENGTLMLGYPPRRDFRASLRYFDLHDFFAIRREGDVYRDTDARSFYSEETDPTGRTAMFYKGLYGLAAAEARPSENWPAVAWQLIHMLMFHRDYAPNFGAFVGLLNEGEDTITALGKVYKLSRLDQDLALYCKTPSHRLERVKADVEAPLTAQPVVLSAMESAPILAELRADK